MKKFLAWMRSSESNSVIGIFSALIAIMSVFFLILTVFSNTPAEQVKAEHAELHANAERVVGTINYIKDPRTGLCYAVLRGGGFGVDALSIASVPCTPQVEKLVEQGMP